MKKCFVRKDIPVRVEPSPMPMPVEYAHFLHELRKLIKELFADIWDWRNKITQNARKYSEELVQLLTLIGYL